MKRLGVRLPLLAATIAVSLLLTGCAYWNTYYSAKKNFDAAERLYDNPEDHATPQQAALYDKAIQGATKVVAKYPQSKWVDDAVFLTGRSLYGKGEYEKARKTFDELNDKFPDSPFRDQALYYTAESFRREHKWDGAEVYYDSLRRTFPQSRMLDETSLREAEIALAQLRPRDAISTLRTLDPAKLSHYAEYEWHHTLADACFAASSYDTARVEYQWVASKSKTQDSYHQAMLRQGDCLEGARQFAAAADFYHDYEKGARTLDYHDQASIRRASALAAGGHVQEGLDLLQDIVNDKMRVAVAPQALYQIGFIQETQGEDSKAARATYTHVTELYKTSPYAQQAKQRIDNLDKMDALRAAAASDTTGREAAAAAAFSVAERYLVDSDRPERAIQEYAKVEHDFAKTQSAPKASFAAGWVLARKLQRKSAADSVWNHLLSEYPQTQYGQAASALLRGREDSLRTVGAFGSSLVKYPFSPNAQLYVPPETRLLAAKAAAPAMTRADSIRIAHQARADSLGIKSALARADTTKAHAPPDTTKAQAPPDTTKAQAPPDTTSHKTSPSGSSGPTAPAKGDR